MNFSRILSINGRSGFDFAGYARKIEPMTHFIEKIPLIFIDNGRAAGSLYLLMSIWTRFAPDDEGCRRQQNQDANDG